LSNELEVTTSVVEKKDSKSLAQEAVSADLVKTRPKIQRRKLGRPLKKDIEAKKKGNRGKVGRPAGDSARIAEFKARLLGTSGDKIIETLIAKALNPDDKDNMAALKLCVDRILPVSVFDAAKNGGTTPQISINITSLTQPEITADVVDMGAVEEEDDNA
jgi:hypothetical protein